MVERLQLSLLEGNKKLVSESIQINPIVPETPNHNRNANQETRQTTVELNIVEGDENVTSEPRSANCFNLLTRIFLCFIVLVGCFLIGGYILLICYLFSLQTTASQIFGLILLVVIFTLLSSICITFCFEAKL